ncbi:MAG: hypothetical protein P1P65_04265 [Treponema sp.]
MKRILQSIILLCTASVSGFADTPYALFVENNHWIYDAMHILSVESRQTTLADRRPLSKGELYEHFSVFETAKIPAASEPLYGMMQNYFGEHPFLITKKYLRFDVNSIFALQGQYVHRPNNEVRLDSFLRYNRTPPIISVPMQVMFTPYVSFYADLAVKKNYWANELSYPYTNIPFEANAFDAHFPTQAGISIGGNFCNLTIGRGALHIGRSLAGSMFLDGTLDRIDYMTASFFHKKVRLSMNVMELEPTRFVFSHEAAFRPLDWLAIRFYEGVVLNTPFDPKYLNPMMIFHNYFGWWEDQFNHTAAGTPGSSKTVSRIGCQLGLGVDMVPVRGLRLYGQYGQNQFQTRFEKKNYSGAANIPNSLGGLFGIEYIHPFKIGHLSVTGEFLYANPWMYIMENKNISLYHRRKDTVAGKNKTDSPIMIWMANPYGPDTMGGFLQCALVQPKKYSAKIQYRFLVKGENEDKFFKDTSSAYYPKASQYDPLTDAKTPSRVPVYFHTFSLAGAYNIIKHLELSAGLNCTFVHGNKRGRAVDFYTGIKYAVR